MSQQREPTALNGVEVAKWIRETSDAIIMKENSYSFYEKMDVLERKLGKSFFRSHRGFLVNLSEVSRYDKANIFLKNGEKVYLSKQKYNDFVTTYMNYLREA